MNGNQEDLLFPDQVTRKAKDRDHEEYEIEHSICPKTWDNASIFCRETYRGCDERVQGQEQHRKDK